MDVPLAHGLMLLIISLFSLLKVDMQSVILLTLVSTIVNQAGTLTFCNQLVYPALLAVPLVQLMGGLVLSH